MLAVTPRACESGRPGSNGPPRSGAPVLCLLSYVRMRYARLDSNQRPPPSQGGALSAELRACAREPPAGVEPAPRPYKGRVLAVDTTEAEQMETAGVEPASSSVQARRSVRQSHVPTVLTCECRRGDVSARARAANQPCYPTHLQPSTTAWPAARRGGDAMPAVAHDEARRRHARGAPAAPRDPARATRGSARPSPS